jgi:excisionase family DNA binding protein
MSAPSIRITRRGEEVHDDQALLTVPECTAWLRCSTPTVYRLLRAGKIRGVHIGSALRIYRGSVVAYLRDQEAGYRPRGSRATFGKGATTERSP